MVLVNNFPMLQYDSKSFYQTMTILTFGEKLSVDLMLLEGKGVYYIIDTATHFLTAIFWTQMENLMNSPLMVSGLH